jgi:hypothetical protein
LFAVALFISIAGPFRNARRDDVAMIGVLALGAVGAWAGCFSGFDRHANAKGSGARKAAGCLWGALNLAAGCFLTYVVLGISRRMY